jgi:UTP--glucose-1-phosphate uridylyltransferase
MIYKAVIPAAGFGTRMLPAARAVPKEMLPILDRPTIQLVVEEAAAAGVSDVVLITSRQKSALIQHFRPNVEIESRLDRTGRRELLASVDDLMRRVKVSEVDQPEQLGLGDAVRQARGAVGGEPFLCMLGDAVFAGEPTPARQLVEAHARFGGTVVGVERVPAEKVSRYGIVAGHEVAPGVLRVTKLVEKPHPADAPSDLAIAGRYLLSPAVFDSIDAIAPGAGGEIQLTDALQLLLAREPVHAVVLAAARHDIGNPTDWLRANLAFAARRPEIWTGIAPMLRELLATTTTTTTTAPAATMKPADSR